MPLRTRLAVFAAILGLVTGCARDSSGVTTVTRPGKVLPLPIRSAQKWNPLWSFGNADDPVPPDWYRPGSPNRQIAWQGRNPLHNFTHYVIGVTD